MLLHKLNFFTKFIIHFFFHVGGLSTGVIIGIVVGAVVVILLIGVLVFILLKPKKKGKGNIRSTPSIEANYQPPPPVGQRSTTADNDGIIPDGSVEVPNQSEDGVNNEAYEENVQ